MQSPGLFCAYTSTSNPWTTSLVHLASACLSYPFCRGCRPWSYLIGHCLFLGHNDMFLAQCLL